VRLPSPWQVAQDLSLVPARRVHSSAPPCTHSIAGFCASSRCSAWVVGLMSSKPERRSAGGAAAGAAIPRVSATPSMAAAARFM
jgi:hypothetical protein